MTRIQELINNAISAIKQASDIVTLNNIRIEYLGKKGALNLELVLLNKLPSEQRSILGAVINEAKNKLKKALDIRKLELEKATLSKRLNNEIIDVSLPGRRIEVGCLHPVTHTINRIENFFTNLGFIIVIGPEIEDNYHNFDALNIPSYHSSRTEQDTFWFDTNRLLRTQTSGVQIRAMKDQQPPIRIISSGRVYRRDYDQTHTPMFHQMEGLIVDKNISFTKLKGTLYDFLFNFFENDLKISFRPSYFPFTEPSAEIDIINKNGKWLEVLGCGMVHPNVLNNVGINPEIYSGFAFGIGIERLTMLRYDVSDLRAFFENDLRFLKQFK